MESPPPMCTARQEITIAAGHVVDLATHKQVRAPYGLKWLVLDKHIIRLLYRAFCQLSMDTYAEHYFKMLVASGHLKVTSPPLAGSDSHYSLVDGGFQEACVPHCIRSQCMDSGIHQVFFVNLHGNANRNMAAGHL